MKSILKKNFIEWPEDNNENEVQIVKTRIMEILKDRISSEMAGGSPHYFLIPSPLRNKKNLLDNITSNPKEHDKESQYELVEFGFKNRGNAFLFKNKENLLHAIPIFFQHKPESLIIGALDRAPQKTKDTRIIFEKLMGFNSHNTVNANYIGMVFDCDRLIEIF